MSETKRTCTVCGDTKPISHYMVANTARSYRRRKCIACYKQQRKASRLISDRKPERKEKMRGYMQVYRQQHPARAILRDSRKSDVRKNRSNDLTIDFIAAAIANPCSYCSETSLRMTLDRIDNSLGHLQANVVPACIRCNYLRGSTPYAAWLCLVPGLREAASKGLFGSWTGRCRGKD